MPALDDSDELSQSTWPADYDGYIFVGRAISRLQVTPKKVWAELQSGELRAAVILCGTKDSREPTLIPPIAFAQVDCPTNLQARGEVEWRDRHEGTHVSLRRRIPVPHWLYLTMASFDGFEARMKRQAATTAAKRFVTDPILAQEGFQAIRAGKVANAFQAAEQVADRAEGGGTRTSKKTRLYKLIQQLVESSPPKSSKHL